MENGEVFQVSQTNQTELCRYGLEAYLLISQEEYNNISEKIDFPDSKWVNVILDAPLPF